MNNSNATRGTIGTSEYLSVICSEGPIAMSVLDFISNFTLILVTVDQLRGIPGRPPPAQLHLIFLAISDISVGIFFIIGAVWLLLLPSDLRQVVDADHLLHLRLIFYYLFLVTFVNRTLTL